MTNVEKYLLHKKNAWSPATHRTVSSILNKYADDASRKSPEDFFNSLATLKPYSKKVTMSVITAYLKYVEPYRGESYGCYLRNNRYAFKGAYKRKDLPLSFVELERRLSELPSSIQKDEVVRLYSSAQRWSEGGGRGKFILGKGDKQRLNLADTERSPEATYFKVYRFLKKEFGISPHALRKLALTKAAHNGATAADLCAIAGWSSISPAYNYLQPQSVGRLKALIGGKNDQ